MTFFRIIISIFLLFAATASQAMTLDEALALGRQRSLVLENPRIDRMRINGQITEAWSNALPQIEGLATYQRAFKPSTFFFPNPETGEFMKLEAQQDNSATAGATLNQPLYTFGRVAAGLKAAYAGKKSNEHYSSFTGRSLELEIASRYWTVLLLRDVLEARELSLSISDSSLQQMQRRRDVGLTSDYDVLRTQVQANNQIPQVRQAENSLHLAELSLKELLGVPMDTTVTFEGELMNFVGTTLFDTSSVNVLGRDDLEALRAMMTAYKNIYIISRNARYPVLSGQLSYSWQWSSDDWGVNPRNNASAVAGGLALSIPIWTSGRDHGKAQQVKADWRKAELNLAQAERGAQLQYESALRSFGAAVASEEAAQLAVEQASEARRIAQTKLQQGQITPLEMDAAQLDELVARVTLAQARFDRLIAAAEARMAAGLSPYSK